MRRTRQALAIAIVATALCADRALAAAPALSPQVTAVAGRLVSRLSVSFRRVVSSTRVYQDRWDSPATIVSIPHIADVSSVRRIGGTRLSPLLLHLPPPNLLC